MQENFLSEAKNFFASLQENFFSADVAKEYRRRRCRFNKGSNSFYTAYSHAV